MNEIRRKAATHLAEGYTVVDIARMLGRKATTVAEWLGTKEFCDFWKSEQQRVALQQQRTFGELLPTVPNALAEILTSSRSEQSRMRAPELIVKANEMIQKRTLDDPTEPRDPLERVDKHIHDICERHNLDYDSLMGHKSVRYLEAIFEERTA